MSSGRRGRVSVGPTRGWTGPTPDGDYPPRRSERVGAARRSGRGGRDRRETQTGTNDHKVTLKSPAPSAPARHRSVAAAGRVHTKPTDTQRRGRTSVMGHRRRTAIPRWQPAFRAGPDEVGAPAGAARAGVTATAALMLLLAAPASAQIADAPSDGSMPGTACVTRMTPTDPPRFIQSGPGCGRS
ncbi:hypothetical protein FRAHR75_590032 [Frankia sp. Hr75.2]|nr:hypothetical protein FRAHR75_590032 [Frankia sp. Hr75.2]SQD93723.1 hypothetical protein FMEAI12_1830022 [Parafrankia sp. Ea1.12]